MDLGVLVMNDFTKEELQYMIDNYSNEKKTIYVLEGATENIKMTKFKEWEIMVDVNPVTPLELCRILDVASNSEAIVRVRGDDVYVWGFSKKTTAIKVLAALKRNKVKILNTKGI